MVNALSVSLLRTYILSTQSTPAIVTLVFQSGQVIETIAVKIALAEGNGGKRRALEMILAARVSPHHEVRGSNFSDESLTFFFCLHDNIKDMNKI